MLSIAGPIVDLILLRGLAADTALRPGLVLAAKVLEREGERGMLLLNGVRVPAALPPELAAGDALRVRVTEATPERVTLQVLPQPPAAPAGTPPSPLTVGLPLPGGARLRVEPDPPSSSGATAAPARRTIALRFDSPALGRIDFLLDVDPAAASATVEVAAGAAPLARSAANDLRTALSTATARPSAVTIRAREETLDVRA